MTTTAPKTRARKAAPVAAVETKAAAPRKSRAKKAAPVARRALDPFRALLLSGVAMTPLAYAG